MLALNRFFGNGAFILTIAPSTWKDLFLYRLAGPHQSNYGNLNALSTSISIPCTNQERNNNADVVTFIRSMESIIQHLLRIGQKFALTKRAESSVLPWKLRQRGLLGHIHATYTATEHSEDGHLHIHLLVNSVLNWRRISQFADNSELNKCFGQFIDSIISTELSSVRVFDHEPKPEFPNPTVTWRTVEESANDVPQTATTLPLITLIHTSATSTCYRTAVQAVE